ncbi:antibiotic biosynthesis monooxygenase [Pseudonocardia sp. WMMC193]|uniref:antibiotic biosynthesis monooxygenase family protein n=1 Tax=Pseudonocardia sp. WMMC193 TaxID=2911965 RepID=UPI001F457751|nr:antibiotic biosynthesis monooxygenase [Pseudonocardia sp. WMMC193]MCF7553642.1 antibiotic biosynthesis monooxygenase [Pseudonocardia sp. WMMC193]
MVVEHAYITVATGREADFEAAFVKAQPILTGAQGCRDAALFPDVEHSGAYLLRVTWERLEDHLEVFPGSDAGREFGAHVAHFFDGAPEVRHFAADAVGA